MFVVSPDLQNHGVSTLLIQEAIRMLRSRGVEGVSIHVRQGALGLARAYEAVGFRRATEGDVDLRPEIFLEAFVLELKSELD
jgi:predicted N-acetyltransferase YhbS